MNNFVKGLLYFFIICLIIYFISLGFSFYYSKNIEILRDAKIGLIEIEGIILSSRYVIKQLKKFKKLDSVKAIVIRIDSPGGGVAPAQEIYSEILRFKKETGKKVVVSFGNIAASGGYYIACAANKIVSNPGTITGSFGVILKIPNFQELFQKIGYEEQIIKSGELKDIGSISRKLTKNEKFILEEMVIDVYEQFIEAISQSRNIDIETIKKIADGRIFSGRKGKELNLIDELGTLEDAIKLAAELAEISGEPKIVKIKKDQSFFEYFKDFISERLPIDPFNWSPLKLQYMPF